MFLIRNLELYKFILDNYSFLPNTKFYYYKNNFIYYIFFNCIFVLLGIKIQFIIYSYIIFILFTLLVI